MVTGLGGASLSLVVDIDVDAAKVIHLAEQNGSLLIRQCLRLATLTLGPRAAADEGQARLRELQPRYLGTQIGT